MELVNAEPFWLSELADLGASPSGDRRKSWDVGYVDKLLPGSSWGLGFTLEVSCGEKAVDMPKGSFRLLRRSHADAVWLEARPLNSSWESLQFNPSRKRQGAGCIACSL